jgi:enterochelin esterase family protein
MLKKTILLLALLVAVGATSVAQQALWGGPEIISPEIRPDNTASFRLQAPQALKVELTGDFLLPSKMQTPMGEFDAPGVAELVKNDQGVWKYTTPAPLAPELYSYTFIIDGVKVTDPANVYMIRDVASVTSVFIIAATVPTCTK